MVKGFAPYAYDFGYIYSNLYAPSEGVPPAFYGSFASPGAEERSKGVSMDLRTCRLWQTHFEIIGKLNSMPYPFEVVREVQDKSYYIDCSKRSGQRGAQFSYTLSGEGCFKIKDKVIRLLPGMGFLQNHDDKRNAYYYPENGTEPWHFIWISFLSPAVEKMVKEINSNYGQIFHIPSDSHLIKSLFSYESSKRSVRFISPFEGAHLVMDILTDLGKYASPENSRKKAPTLLVRHAQEYMHHNIEKPLSIEDIAEKCEISREHLSRIFKEQLGESPSSYLIKRRMEQACRLLISTNLSCKEIALRTGYENVVSFNRTFKRLVKMTPGELRIAGYAPEIR